MGLWQPSAGAIRLRDRQIGGPGMQENTSDIVGLGISYVPEDMGIFTDLSVAENMLLAARSARRLDEIDAERLDWIFELFPALRTFWLYPAGKLSGGQKQMLAIARAMIEPRQLLLIDEPCKGLSPAIVKGLVRAFHELKRSRIDECDDRSFLRTRYDCTAHVSISVARDQFSVCVTNHALRS